MKQTVTCYFLFILAIVSYGSAYSAGIKTYQSTVTAPILENDTVFAKNSAFQTAQVEILFMAIHELIADEIFAEYKRQIQYKNSLVPKDYLVSVKVISEFSKDDTFTIEIEGGIDTDSLEKTLRKRNLILQNDPWYSITFVLDNQLKIPTDKIEKRLAVFHLKIDQTVSVDFTPVKNLADTRIKETAKLIFENYPKNKIAISIEGVDNEDLGTINRIKIRIFRRSGLDQINTFSLNMPFSFDPNQDTIDPILPSLLPKIISSFTIQSLKRSVYNQGAENIFYLEVLGLYSPYIRSIFEKDILKQNRSIQNFRLTRLSSQSVEYEIRSNASLNSLTANIKKENSAFEFIVDENGFNALKIESIFKLTEQERELLIWKYNENVVNRIKESILEEKILLDEDLEEVELDNSLIPEYQENEPNNNSKTVNFLPENSQMIGRISSRADEDIFLLQGKQKEGETALQNITPVETITTETEKDVSDDTTEDNGVNLIHDEPEEEREIVPFILNIEWIKIGKSTLSPQLRLYDENFNFLNIFPLIGSQKKLSIQFSFKDYRPPKLYIRLSDKIGFIQGETGGFKYFDYLLRYSWDQTSDTEEKNTEFPGNSE